MNSPSVNEQNGLLKARSLTPSNSFKRNKRPQMPHRASSFRVTKPLSRNNSFKRNTAASRSNPNSPNASFSSIDWSNEPPLLPSKTIPSRSNSASSLHSLSSSRGTISHERDRELTAVDKILRWCRRSKNAARLMVLTTLLLSGRSMIGFYMKMLHGDFEDGMRANSHTLANKRQQLENPALALALEAHTTSPNEHQTSKLSSTKNNNTLTRSNIAYAWLLAGLPSPNDAVLPEILGNVRQNISVRAYRGLVYNILVSVKILRDSGSRADMVVMVQMTSPAHELSAEDSRLLNEMNIRVKYIPPTPNLVNGFSTIALEKFRILDLTQYERVLYMDPDITPHCNLDYVMELTLPRTPNDTKPPKLKENFVLSIGNVPASASFFVLSPRHGAFQRLTRFLASWPLYRKHFDTKIGWGKINMLEKEPWRSLAETNGTNWSFEGSDSDNGILYFWVRFMEKSFSHAIGNQVEMWSGGNKYKILENPFKQYTCLPMEEEKSGIGKLWYSDQKLKMIVSPLETAPYRDFSQWRHTNHRPWNYAKAPASVASKHEVVRTSRKFWFHTVRQLDHALNMGLNFIPDLPEISPTEKVDGKPNWNYIPKKDSKNLNPIFSTKIQAVQQWALREVNTSATSFNWEPPILHEKVVSDNLRAKCRCPETISTDPCTSSQETLESWLKRRVPYHLSKQRPLCPNAAKNNMHVVIPYHNSELEGVQKTTCSVICQDYPPEKLSIYLYEDGSSQDTLNNLCSRESLMDFQPLADAAGSSEYDVNARNHATPIAEQILKRFQSFSGRTSVACIQTKEYLGFGGAEYWALRLVEALAGPNDAVLVLPPNTEFSINRALQVVNENFLRTGAWTIYGGKMNALPTSFRDSTRPFTPRQYFFPRAGGWSFKAHLLKHITSSDFLDKDGTWLKGNAAPGLTYRVLELAGQSRFTALLESVFTEDENEKKRVISSSVVTPELDHPRSLEPSRPVLLPIHIVIALRGDTALMRQQLQWIQNQTIVSTQAIHVHYLINNAKTKAAAIALVGEFHRESEGLSEQRLLVSIVQKPEDWLVFSRFYYVHELRKKQPLDNVVFLDDDQYINPDFLESILERHKPAAMTASYGKRFNVRNPKTRLANFRNSSISWNDIATHKKNILFRSFAFGALGGSVLDANLWLFDQQLFRLVGDLPEYNELDDIWVSFVLDALLGWNIHRQIGPIPVNVAMFDQQAFEKALFPRLPEGHSQLLLQLNNVTADRILLTQKQTKKLDDLKSAMFQQTQARFHWYVFRPEGGRPMREIIKADFKLTPAPAPEKDSNRIKRAFVCITGQFDRFELQNKIDNLFGPLQQVGYSTDAALALSAGEAVFTNKKSRKFDPFYTKFDDAIKVLQTNNIHVLSLNGTYPRIERPYVNQNYFSLLYRAQGQFRSEADQLARVQNHARIFESYLRCLHYADQGAAEAGTTLESYYDVVIRIRDDIGFNRPLSQMGNVMSSLIPPPPNSLAVTECRSWYGQNDRLAIVSPDAAREYFTRPYEIFVKNWHVDERLVTNPESFLLYAFITAKIHVLGHPSLKRLNRVVNRGDGKGVFYQDDQFDAGCPAPFTYLQRHYDLYGWVL